MVHPLALAQIVALVRAQFITWGVFFENANEGVIEGGVAFDGTTRADLAEMLALASSQVERWLGKLNDLEHVEDYQTDGVSWIADEKYPQFSYPDDANVPNEWAKKMRDDSQGQKIGGNGVVAFGSSKKVATLFGRKDAIKAAQAASGSGSNGLEQPTNYYPVSWPKSLVTQANKTTQNSVVISGGPLG